MPHVRVTLSLGLPNPDHLSTMLLWSLVGHIGALAGVLIYQALPSAAPPQPGPYFVRLAAPGPAPATAPAAGGPEPPAAQAAKPAAQAAAPAAVPLPDRPTHKPTASPPRETAVPSPPPSKASLPPEKVVKGKPHAAESQLPAQDARTHEEAVAGGSAGHAGTGTLGAAGPQGAAAGTGVGGTSFGEGDFRYGWYQSAIEAKLQSHWRPAAATSEIQKVTVSFSIRRDGTLAAVKVAEPSGNSALDLSVLRAVYDSAPLPMLPPGWSGDQVHVTMEFRLTADAGAEVR